MSFYNMPLTSQNHRGFVHWDELGYQGSLYHACSLASAEAVWMAQQISCKSHVEVSQKNGTAGCPGLWTSLNVYDDGSHFGPAALKWSTNILAHETFVVFQGLGSDAHRWTLLQARPKGTNLTPEDMFDIHPVRGTRFKLHPRPNVYNIVLTRPPDVSAASLIAVGDTKGTTKSIAAEEVERIAKAYLTRYVEQHPQVQKEMERYPDLQYISYQLPVRPPGHPELQPALDLDL